MPLFYKKALKSVYFIQMFIVIDSFEAGQYQGIFGNWTCIFFPVWFLYKYIYIYK